MDKKTSYRLIMLISRAAEFIATFVFHGKVKSSGCMFVDRSPLLTGLAYASSFI